MENLEKAMKQIFNGIYRFSALEPPKSLENRGNHIRQ